MAVCISDRPAVALALSFSTGIALSLVCREYSFAGLATAGILLILAASLALRRNRLELSLALGLAAILVSGLVMALAHRDGIHPLDVRLHVSQKKFPLRQPVSFEGCILQENEYPNGQKVATVELLTFMQKDQRIPSKGKAFLRIAEPSGEFRLMRGDRIKGWAIWDVPRNFGNPGSADTAGRLERRGIFLIGRVKSFRLLETIPGGCSNPWIDLANQVGSRVHESLQPVLKKYGSQPAAILASLVIGDYSGLNNATREVFQNAGAFHVLVVSGLHVAWIAGLLLQFFKMIRLPERLRYLLVFGVILLYTCIVGFQASITRCLWMFLLYLSGKMLFRRAEAVNILLGSALILLLAQPDWLFEVGFQLSFLSVLAIALTAVPAINAYLKPLCQPLLHCGKPDRLFLQRGRWHRRGRSIRVKCEILIEEAADRYSPCASRILLPVSRGLATAALALGSMLLTSLAVQAWLEPLLACYFNRLSWISPLANLVIVPFSSVVLCAGAAVSIAAGLPAIGSVLSDISGSLASLLLACAVRITAIAGAWQRCPTPTLPWILAGIVALFAWGFFRWRRFWIPCTGIALVLASLSVGSVSVIGILLKEFRHLVQAPNEEFWDKNAPVLSLTFLDVGEGDSTVIRFPDSRVWIVDAGGIGQSPSEEEGVQGFDVGEAVVSRFLWHYWICRIDRLVLSHSDLDHAGGTAALMRNFRIGRLDHAQTGSDRIITAILKTARERQIPIGHFRTGNKESAGSVEVHVLHPPGSAILGSTNEASVVLKFSYKRFSALLTGDLEKSGEALVLSSPGSIHCRLLKVAHHGSRSGTSNMFLDRTQPRWAVISAGRNNPFGHPSKETLARLRSHSVWPLLTTEEGAITMETDGERYLIKSYANGVLERGEL